jgi:two-component system NarL family sensor kinase
MRSIKGAWVHVLLVYGLLASVPAAADKALVFGYSADGAPVSYHNLLGGEQPEGFCGYVADYLQADGYQLTFQSLNFDQRFDFFPKALGNNNPKKRKTGVLCGPNSQTRERQENLNSNSYFGEFSKVFFTTKAKLLIRKDKQGLLKDNPQKLRIGVLGNSTTSVELVKNISHMITPEPFPSRYEAVNALLTDRIDAYVSDEVILKFILDTVIAAKGRQQEYSIEEPREAAPEEYVLVVYNAVEDPQQMPSVLKGLLDGWIADPERGKKAVEATLEKVFYPKDTVEPENTANLKPWLLGMAIMAALFGMWCLWSRLRGRVAGASSDSMLSPLELDERRHFSRELHDNILQLLAAAKRRLELALRQLDKQDAAYQENLSVSLTTLEETIDEVRRISHEMRSEMEDALDALLRDFNERNGIEVQKSCDVHLKDLPDRTALMLYRVTQEALMNVEHHAAATLVEVRLKKAGKQLRMDIRDNGQGFDPTRLPVGKGIGLKNMRERIELLGGKLHVDSAPGRGTLLWAIIPL